MQSFQVPLTEPVGKKKSQYSSLTSALLKATLYPSCLEGATQSKSAVRL